MIGPRLFRSRWAALFWAGGMIWTAYDVASATKAGPAVRDSVDAVDATGLAVDANDLAVLANLGGAH